MGYTKKQKRQMLNILVETGFKKFESYTRFREIYPTFARQTLDSWIKKDKEFKAAYDLEMEKQVEEAEEHHRYLRLGIGIKEEGKIIGWIEKPDRQAIENYLRKMEKGSWSDSGEKVAGVSINIGFGIEDINKPDIPEGD